MPSPTLPQATLSERLMSSFPEWLRRAWGVWRKRAALSVLDQGTLSGANFLGNLLLVRWLSPDDYGRYAVGFALAFFFLGPYTALFVEPLSVLGATRYRQVMPGYVRQLWLGHWLVALPASALFLGTCWLGGWGEDQSLVAALALMLPFYLLTTLLRALCYLASAPERALVGSVVFATVFLGITFGLRSQQQLSPSSAVLAFAAAHLCSSLTMLPRERRAHITTDETAQPAAVTSADVVREHWRFGHSILLASVAASASSSLLVPSIGALLGPTQAAVLRALQLLVTPCQQVLVALSNLALPRMAQETDALGRAYLRRAGTAFVSLALALAGIYALAMLGTGPLLLARLFGAPYAPYAWGVLPLAVYLLLQTLTNGLGIVLRAAHNARSIMLSKLASCLLFLGVGLLLVRSHGLSGALWTLPIMAGIEALVCGAGLALLGAPREPGR